MSNSIGCLWFLAIIGVTYLAVSFFGEGRSSATVASIAATLLTIVAITASDKK